MNSGQFNFKAVEVNSLHKAGTSIQRRIFKEISIHKDFNFFDGEMEKTNKPFIRTMRKVNEKNNLLTADDALNIFILRHPISSIISAYYSYGWTHPTDVPPEITDTSKRKDIENYLKKLRNEVKELSLNEYVEEFINSPEKSWANQDWVTAYNRILCDSELKNNYNFAFIPYEIFLINYRKVSDIISKLLDLETLYTYNNFKHFFKKQKDLSSDIVEDGLIVHKRNTNIYEYREKISEDIIRKFQKAFPITNVFEEYVENEKCIINLNENRNIN